MPGVAPPPLVINVGVFRGINPQANMLDELVGKPDAVVGNVVSQPLRPHVLAIRQLERAKRFTADPAGGAAQIGPRHQTTAKVVRYELTVLGR